MTIRRGQLREDAHFRILSLLNDKSEMSRRDLETVVGVSTDGIHHVLGAVLDKGWITRALARKVEEYKALRAEIEDLRAGIKADQALGDAV